MSTQRERRRFSLRYAWMHRRRRPPQAIVCRNCGTRTRGRFCPECGQPAAKRLASVRRMVREVVEDQLSVNGKLPRTLAALLFRPGFLTREYVVGRIARYVPPFRLYLASSLLFFIVLPFIADFDRLWRAVGPPMERAARGEPRPSAAGEERSAGRDGAARNPQPFAIVRSGIDTASVPGWIRPVAAYYVRQEAKINAMAPREATRVLYGETTENVPRLIFLLLPLFALFLKALYRRRLYAEHFVFALHFHACLFLLATLALVAQSMAVLVAFVLASPVYLLVALKQAYGQPWPVTAAKYLLLLSVYYATFMFAIASVMFVVVLTA